MKTSLIALILSALFCLHSEAVPLRFLQTGEGRFGFLDEIGEVFRKELPQSVRNLMVPFRARLSNTMRDAFFFSRDIKVWADAEGVNLELKEWDAIINFQVRLIRAITEMNNSPEMLRLIDKGTKKALLHAREALFDGEVRIPKKARIRALLLEGRLRFLLWQYGRIPKRSKDPRLNQVVRAELRDDEEIGRYTGWIFEYREVYYDESLRVDDDFDLALETIGHFHFAHGIGQELVTMGRIDQGLKMSADAQQFIKHEIGKTVDLYFEPAANIKMGGETPALEGVH